MSVSPRQNFSKPPPVPEVPTVTRTPEFSAGSPHPLFSHSGLVYEFPEQQYDVAADGQRFVVIETLVGEGPRTIRVVQNWYAEFRDRQEK